MRFISTYKTLYIISICALTGFATVSSASELTVIEPVKLEVQSKYDSRIGDDRAVHVSVEYPEIMCVQESGYEGLAQSLDTLTSSMRLEAEAFADQYESLENMAYEDEIIPFRYDQKLQLRRGDSGIVSLFTLVSDYTGGAHGNYYYDTHNFDAQTGHELLLEDVLNDGVKEQLAHVIGNHLLGKYTASHFMVEDVAEGVQSVIDYSGALKFTLDPEGITFYFPPYALTDYATGAVIDTLPYEEYPDLVKDEYQQKPGKYITPVLWGRETPLEDAEGTSHTLMITREVPEGKQSDSLVKIKYGTKELSEEIYAVDYAAYLVHDDNRSYLYLETEHENGWKKLHIYDLNGDDITGKELPESRWMRNEAATDPDEMELEKRIHLLSTLVCWRPYHLNAEGVPEASQDYDFIENKNTLTTKAEVEAEVRSGAQYTEGSREMLPVGTVLSFYATDGETWVDMKTADERYVRLQVNPGWPQCVNGIDAKTLFDGMQYAG